MIKIPIFAPSHPHSNEKSIPVKVCQLILKRIFQIFIHSRTSENVQLQAKCILHIRNAQNIWCLNPQTPKWRLAQKVKVYQVSGPGTLDHVCRAVKTSTLPIKKDSVSCFPGSVDVIKHPWMDLKLGAPSRFGPIFSLEFGK